jgi:nucleotide-binding universal stress UspA family protein
MFKTVLFPIDMSSESQHAISKVAELVKYHHSRLVLLSVVESSEAAPGQPPIGANLPRSSGPTAGAGERTLCRQSIETEVIERQGQPAFVICDVADELNADLITMGCRGVGLIEEVQEESVTNRVINLSPCPVLIIP